MSWPITWAKLDFKQFVRELLGHPVRYVFYSSLPFIPCYFSSLSLLLTLFTWDISLQKISQKPWRLMHFIHMSLDAPLSHIHTHTHTPTHMYTNPRSIWPITITKTITTMARLTRHFALYSTNEKNNKNNNNRKKQRKICFCVFNFSFCLAANIFKE